MLVPTIRREKILWQQEKSSPFVCNLTVMLGLMMRTWMLMGKQKPLPTPKMKQKLVTIFCFNPELKSCFQVCGAPPGEYQNPVNKKKIRVISRESLGDLGDPYPATENIDTAEKMRAECGMVGEGWQTLEVEHFYEWQYINHAAWGNKTCLCKIFPPDICC